MSRSRERVPAPDGSRWRAPSRPTLACVAVCGLIVLAGAIDYANTESKLPDVAARECDPANLECFNASREEQIARNRAAEPLEDQFNSRAWLYAFAILAVCALAVANSLRVRPRTRVAPGVHQPRGDRRLARDRGDGAALDRGGGVDHGSGRPSAHRPGGVLGRRGAQGRSSDAQRVGPSAARSTGSGIARWESASSRSITARPEP